MCCQLSPALWRCLWFLERVVLAVGLLLYFWSRVLLLFKHDVLTRRLWVLLLRQVNEGPLGNQEHMIRWALLCHTLIFWGWVVKVFAPIRCTAVGMFFLLAHMFGGMYQVNVCTRSC